jgi:hypothetical protein
MMAHYQSVKFVDPVEFEGKARLSLDADKDDVKLTLINVNGGCLLSIVKGGKIIAHIPVSRVFLLKPLEPLLCQ